MGRRRARFYDNTVENSDLSDLVSDQGSLGHIKGVRVYLSGLSARISVISLPAFLMIRTLFIS